MADVVEGSQSGLEAEEARLARAAAAGDGEAFATLYERYSQRAYNLSLRLCGSDEDAADAVQEAFVSVIRRLKEMEAERELAFGSYLFTATRNATYDLLRRAQRTRPSDAIAESATPLGAGAGGLGLDPGAPEEDPDRNVLLASQQEEVRAANARLPERQREALALRELEEMSYDEIAAVMEMNRNSVAQLISRARISLRDELRGTALASVTAASPECERALPLIAARDDGQLDPDSEDASWLAAHLASCETCLVATAAMEEAGVSYRAWIPVAVAPWIFKETMARAAELSGSDWSGIAECRLADPTDPSRIPGLPRAYRTAAAVERGPRRRRAALVGVLAVLLLLGGSVVALSAGGGKDPAPQPAGDVTEVPVTEPVDEPEPQPAPVEKEKEDEKLEPRKGQAPPDSPEPLPLTEAPPTNTGPTPAESKTKPGPGPDANGNPNQGKGGVGQPSPGRDPQPDPGTEPVPPPPPPPPAGEEPVPPPPPPPPVPGGPGDLKNPPGPPKPG
ncbi:MAG TPA: sigma-70 family RNA polymerase sigma factor [Solirubrobacterales bacterium]|nr:sigma-70 family RNA polymerase sigma factor [Solirubrobacterales bacterium]